MGNTITQNSITQNGTLGIDNFGGNTELAPPTILNVSASSVSGTVCPNCIVEVFSDPEDEGKIYEGTAIADELASAAELVIGQTDEAIPAAIIRGYNYPKSETAKATKLTRPPEEDLFI